MAPPVEHSISSEDVLPVLLGRTQAADPEAVGKAEELKAGYEVDMLNLL